MDTARGLAQVVVHEHHVGGLDGGVRAHGPHGHAHVCTGENRRVVDAVAHIDQSMARGLLGQQSLHLVHLVPGEQLGVHLIQPQLLGGGLPAA